MYSVHIDSRKTVASTIGGYPITEYDILASAIPEPENPPEATLDGNLETRYAVEGMGQWIQFDLHERKRLEKIDLAWFRGAERVYSFEIQLSSDGVNWNQAFKGESSGKTGDVETYSFPPQEARFIKIIGYGSNVNAWNNIAEVR